MFRAVDSDPKPYILPYDRSAKEGHVPTVWWLRPQTAEETSTFQYRWGRQSDRIELPPDARAREVTKVEREQLQSVLSKVDNAFEVGDCLEDPVEIAEAVRKLDYFDLQELLRASQRMSVLGETEKN